MQRRGIGSGVTSPGTSDAAAETGQRGDFRAVVQLAAERAAELFADRGQVHAAPRRGERRRQPPERGQVGPQRVGDVRVLHLHGHDGAVVEDTAVDLGE
ncbi:MAG: hypothetical protein R2712_04995 [Vicinamibacterales bacterium]